MYPTPNLDVSSLNRRSASVLESRVNLGFEFQTGHPKSKEPPRIAKFLFSKSFSSTESQWQFQFFHFYSRNF